eukprot:TRINITY_DN13620_c0_g1_i1.p2 TRINITY_DN13620_c0_g1~~TRINITY_DN13620_c0_g1_i1.p2  ORF type:complete len:203 (+),score=41.56 TRINITY_DN13620_c0_g1_i1:69-677(+)
MRCAFASRIVSATARSRVSRAWPGGVRNATSEAGKPAVVEAPRLATTLDSLRGRLGSPAQDQPATLEKSRFRVSQKAVTYNVNAGSVPKPVSSGLEAPQKGALQASTSNVLEDESSGSGVRLLLTHEPPISTGNWHKQRSQAAQDRGRANVAFFAMLMAMLVWLASVLLENLSASEGAEMRNVQELAAKRYLTYGKDKEAAA